MRDTVPSAGTTDTVSRYYNAFWSGEERRYEPDPALASVIFDGLTADTECLDVGCGSGNSYAARVARIAGSYVGVDVSTNAVAAARTSGLDARTIGDAAELPFPDESFDVVLCIEVLEHLFAPDRAVAEIVRVLRPDGLLAVSAPNVAYWRLRASLALGVWNPIGDELSLERPWRDPHIRFFTPETMERMLRLAGFTRVAIGAHGGRALDHLTTRPTSFGQSGAYRFLQRRFPSVMGLTIHAVARK